MANRMKARCHSARHWRLGSGAIASCRFWRPALLASSALTRASLVKSSRPPCNRAATTRKRQRVARNPRSLRLGSGAATQRRHHSSINSSTASASSALSKASQPSSPSKTPTPTASWASMRRSCLQSEMVRPLIHSPFKRTTRRLVRSEGKESHRNVIATRMNRTNVKTRLAGVCQCSAYRAPSSLVLWGDIVSRRISSSSRAGAHQTTPRTARSPVGGPSSRGRLRV